MPTLTLDKRPIQNERAKVRAIEPLDAPAKIGGALFPDEVAKCTPSKRSKQPCIDEAVVLTEIEVVTATHTHTRSCDPLIVAGRATPGATVRVHNPDIRGWPLVGEEKVDATGAFRVEVTDPRLFARGDRVLVTAEEPGRAPSGGVLRETIPVTERTHVHEHYLDGALRSRTSTTTTSPDARDADDRAPYYDEARVQESARIGAGGIVLDLRGGPKSVPPGTKVSIRTARDRREMRAGDDGAFELTVRGARPGETLEHELEGVHGRLSTVPITVPAFSADLGGLIASGVRRPNGDIALHARVCLSRGDSVVIRDSAGGRTVRLPADEEVEGLLEGVAPWSVLELGVETKGLRSNELSRAVVLPPELGAGALMSLDAPWMQPTLEPVVSAARLADYGDRTALVLDAISDLPPFGRVDVLRRGKIAFELRADGRGRIESCELGGVSAGESLSFVTYDAGGRRLGVDVLAHCVPSADEGRVQAERMRSADNSSLAEIAELIGTGRVGMSEQGAGVKLYARLAADPHRTWSGIDESAPHGRIELSGPFPEGAMTEAARAGRFDSASLAVVDWETGQRNLVFDLYLGGRLEQLSVRVPLPIDGRVPTVRGQAALPPSDACVAMLGRAVGFASLARSLGAGPGDAAYDGSMRAARTLLYALDRIACGAGPAEAEALRDRAKRTLANAPETVVDAARWVPGPGTQAATPRARADAFWGDARADRGMKPWELRAVLGRLAAK